MPTKVLIFDNNESGFKHLQTTLADKSRFEISNIFVVLEATGGYEMDLLLFLCRQNIAVHRVQPLKASHYLRSLRVHGKSDAIDAAALARYGAERHANLALYTPADKDLCTLQALQTRREDLLAMRIAETQRLKHPRYRDLKKSVLAVRKVVEAQIIAIEEQMHELVEANTLLKNKKAVLTDFKGVGETTAMCLIASMPELGTLTRRQVASLAGLAPHPRDSGKYHGYRATRGGRRNVRKALFMAALSAKRYNPQLKLFYDRLIKQGKKPIKALTAVMRKMIVILNAKIRDACYQELNFKTW